MDKNLNQRLTSKLKQRENDGNLRKLNLFEGYIDFFSNDYLGLGEDFPPVGTDNKFAGSSRLIAGNTKVHEELESLCASYFKGDASLLYNSGYVANLGVLSCLPQKDDLILYDELSHASIKDGLRLTPAKALKFKHNDLKDLTNKLSDSSYNSVFVIIEGLYSMDGNLSPVKEISSICKQFNANLIVDEAHSGGVFGNNGAGWCEENRISDVFLRVFTFGKAFGAHGACVVGDSIVIDYLINFSRSFIYTTALPPSLVEHNLNQIQRKDLGAKQENLQKNILYFNEIFKDFEVKGDLKSPIKALRFKDVDMLYEAERALHLEKIGIKAIYSPTVPKGKERLRVSVHANNTHKEIDLLHKTLKNFKG